MSLSRRWKKMFLQKSQTRFFRSTDYQRNVSALGVFSGLFIYF